MNECVKNVSAKPKILYFTDCPIFGGCENILANLINDRGINTKYELYYSYAFSDEYQKGVDLKVGNGAKKYPLKLLSSYSISNKRNGTFMKRIFRKALFMTKFAIFTLFNAIRMFFIFMKIKPDLLHINNGGYPGAFNCRLAVLCARTAGIRKIVFHVNNLARRQANLLDKMLDHYIGSNVICFITASQEAKQMLARNRSFDQSKIMQIYNSVQRGTIRRSKELLMTNYRLDAHMFIITEVAQMIERKGQAHLLAAVNSIKNTRPDIYKNIMVFLVGDGEDAENIKRYIESNDLGGHVILTGNRDDFMDYINACDIFILPSIKDEDMPLAILHAMELGKPIISTKLAGISEEIRSGKDGILLDVDKLSELSETIIEYYSDPGKRLEHGTSAKARHDQMFDYAKIMKKYDCLYRDISEGINK